MTHYIPFGKNCAIAMALRQAGLRQESLPFDWVLGNPEHIRRSLDVRFEDWFSDDVYLAKDDEISIERVNEREAKGHGTVHPNYPVELANGAFFTHFDLTNLEVKKSLKKRIDRFYEILGSDEHVVFVSSIPLDELKSYGLLDYFDKKVDFLLFNWTPSDKRFARISKHMGYDMISYSSPDQFDTQALDMIAALLTSPEIFRT
jgi:hypothetical protein